MVSLCAGCNLYEPWAALIVGGCAGIGFMVVHFVMLYLKLDDPVDAVAVHGGGGLVGILAVPWFMYVGLETGERGIFWDGHASVPWLVLGYNIAGAIVIMLWSAFWSILLFGSLYFLKMLRVSTDDEFKGMDLIKHGESAYPEHGQGLSVDKTISDIEEDKNEDTFNNPFRMVKTFLSVTANKCKNIIRI